ncbi:site-specific tyrosine recombinase XerC [Symmachiella macrocystis]|uniref:Site-specific tyrosine recombinase XerC n=2 Tax=Symmachiella macrocystis TaxID=2527985 RepID=A0A5C6BLA8_9PLAN|nr:site-specific tyrosine recombinase XerC [Symmachiella macrocystis]
MITVYDANGELRRRSKVAKSKADANVFLRELQHDLAAGVGLPADSMNVAQYMRLWLSDVIQGERAENTYESYRLSIKNHIIPRIGRLKLSALTSRNVLSMLAAMKRDEVGGKTRQYAHTVLKTALGRAVAMGEIGKNPVDGVPRPQYQPEEIHPFTQQQMRAIIKESEGCRLGSAVLLAFATGMRQGEIFGLPWSSIDFKMSRLDVKQQLIEPRGMRKLTERLKTPTSRRTIELPASIIARMNQHRAASLKEGLQELVFVDTAGGLIRKSNFRRYVWVRLLKDCGIEYRGFHHIRHTYATLQLTAGVPAHIVADVMGHKDASTLLKVYAHVLEGVQSMASDSIAKLLG